MGVFLCLFFILSYVYGKCVWWKYDHKAMARIMTLSYELKFMKMQFIELNPILINESDINKSVLGILFWVFLELYEFVLDIFDPPL